MILPGVALCPDCGARHLCSGQPPPRVALPPWTRKPLELASHGYTHGRSGRELCVTPDAIAKSLARSRKLLGARNTTEAVAIMIREGYML